MHKTPQRKTAVRKMTNHTHTRPGFTLVECLLAGVILALFGSALAGMIAQTTTAVRRSNDDRLAAQYLDEVLTRIDIIGPARLQYQGPLAGTLGGRFNWSADITPQTDTGLYAVDITLAWTTPAGSRSVQGHTLLMDPAGWRSDTTTWASLQ